MCGMNDFRNLTRLLQSYVEEHKVLPYQMILHCLAYRYLGGGLLDPTYKDEEFPYRSSPQLTVMFFEFGKLVQKQIWNMPSSRKISTIHQFFVLLLLRLLLIGFDEEDASLDHYNHTQWSSSSCDGSWFLCLAMYSVINCSSVRWYHPWL